MAARDEILAYAREFLRLDDYPDYGPMGLQVIGAAEVSRIALAGGLDYVEDACTAIVDRALRAREPRG